MIGIVVATVLGGVVLYRSRRIAPDVPRRWRSSQSVAARLCRRVHRAIDQRLVTASELPLSARHRSLLELRYRIVDLERAASRVVRMAGEAGRPDVEHVRASVNDVHARLDRLEDARRELRDLG